jgi:hypothetical protein
LDGSVLSCALSRLSSRRAFLARSMSRAMRATTVLSQPPRFSIFLASAPASLSQASCTASSASRSEPSIRKATFLRCGRWTSNRSASHFVSVMVGFSRTISSWDDETASAVVTHSSRKGNYHASLNPVSWGQIKALRAIPKKTGFPLRRMGWCILVAARLMAKASASTTGCGWQLSPRTAKHSISGILGAAPAISEAVTSRPKRSGADHVWNQAARCGDERALVSLLLAIAVTSVFNCF